MRSPIYSMNNGQTIIKQLNKKLTLKKWPAEQQNKPRGERVVKNVIDFE